MNLHRMIFSTLCAVLLSVAAHAQSGLSDTQRVLGYSLTDSITNKGIPFDKSGTFPIGALLPAEAVAPYVGCKVVGIRFAVSQSIGRTRVFLNEVGENGLIELQSKIQKTYEGWNNVLFNGDGVTINGGEKFMFGYDYQQTDEMTQAEEGAICTVGTGVTGGFLIYTSTSEGEGFIPVTGAGDLCLQLIIDVSSLPRYDMRMTFLDTGFKYKEPGETIDMLTNIKNVGRDSLTSFVMAYQIDDEPAVETVVTEAIPSGVLTDWKIEVPLSQNIATGMHTIKAFIKSLQGKDLPNDTEKSMTRQFAIYRNTVSRSQVYMEVYTDQESPYVNAFDNAVKKVTESFPHVCVANVFRSGNSLAVDGAAYLHELYAYDYPTFTSNRSYYPGEAYIAYDLNDYLLQIPVEYTSGIIGDVVSQDLEFPSFATISVAATYDEASRQMTIKADGNMLEEARTIYGDVALTLLLTEDKVKSPQTIYNELLGRVTTSKNYSHDHVLRAFITAPTGKTLTPDADGRYSEQVVYTVPAEFVPENLQVIALLTKATDEVTDDNVLEEDIINANSIALSTVLGVHSAVTAPRTSHYYSLDGKRLDTLRGHRGIIIEQQSDGSHRKVMVQ